MPSVAYTPVPSEPGVYLFIGRDSRNLERAPAPTPTGLSLWFVYEGDKFWSPYMVESHHLIGVFHKLDHVLLEDLTKESRTSCAEARAQEIRALPNWEKARVLSQTLPSDYQTQVQGLLK